MICGGKSGAGNLNTCQTYNPHTNKWSVVLKQMQQWRLTLVLRNRDVPSMRFKRHQAASVLDKDGNMWMLGGIDGSDSADATEIFDFAENRWREGHPLPRELRDSGLSSHCAVRWGYTPISLQHLF